MNEAPLMDRLLSAAFHRGRIDAICARMASAHVDGVLMLDASNVYYASGYLPIPSERPIGLYLGGDGARVLYIPLLEQENAAGAGIEAIEITEVCTYFEYPGETHPVQWMLNDIGARRGVKNVGIDSVDYGVITRLQTAITVTMTPIIERLRWIKMPEEIKLIEQAAGYADFCLETLVSILPAMIRESATELDLLRACLGATSAKLKAELGERFILGSGAVVGTVHSGAQAALPHGAPGTRQPQPGDPVIAGIGVSVAGYHAESGATFILDEPRNDGMRCMVAAAECDEAGIKALRAGGTCAQVNEAALGVLRAFGYGDFIRHRIGHGMGINGHESPWLAPGDETILQPNMVFSNEPGIYRPGVDGYRTINTMIVTEGEAQVPSHFLASHPPEMRIIAL